MLRTNINFIMFGLTLHWFENKYTVHEANTLTDAAMTIREALFYNINTNYNKWIGVHLSAFFIAQYCRKK